LINYRLKYILTLTFFIASALNSDISFTQQRGGYAGSFLRLGLGARAMALGGAFVGLTNDGYAGFYNPAGLPNLTEREATLSYRSLSLDRSFTYVGFSVPLPPSAGLAVGWIHAGVDGIDGRDFAGNHTKFFDDSQNGFIFGFGLRPHDRVSIGIGGTILRENLLDITSTGFGFNLGVLFKITEFFIQYFLQK